ncbi:MAG: efflux RND transporter periplasmic adaptor subunit [bacterium]|nr:efflux RND transporter periplasmic adaptor subunit [bacterium]
MNERNFKYVILIIFTLLAAVYFYVGCSRAQEPVKTEDPIPVKMVPVVQKIVSVPLHTSGRLSLKAQAKLSFKTGGIIKHIYVEEGEAVKKGQLLAVLDLSEVHAYVKQEKNGFLKAKRDKERVENLYKDRAATLEQLQDVKTAFEVAESRLTIAAFNLEHSKIAAPSNGKILKRLAEANEMTGAGYPVFVFGGTGDRWVIKAGIGERDIVKVRLQDRAEVRFDAYPGKVFTAYVSEIPGALDPAGGTYEVEIAFAAPEIEVKLISGFVGKVDIHPSTGGNFFIVPVDSLVEGDGSRGAVFTVNKNKAQRVPVVVSHLFGDNVAVRSGLEAVKAVVTSGASYLTDGASVKIVR